jgi:hypothetical protein
MSPTKKSGIRSAGRAASSIDIVLGRSYSFFALDSIIYGRQKEIRCSAN